MSAKMIFQILEDAEEFARVLSTDFKPSRDDGKKKKKIVVCFFFKAIFYIIGSLLLPNRKISKQKF